jgi:hypothetical protein
VQRATPMPSRSSCRRTIARQQAARSDPARAAASRPPRAHAVDPEVLLPDTPDMAAENGVAAGTRRRLRGIDLPGDVGVVGRRGDRRPGGLRSVLRSRQGQQALTASSSLQIGSTP